MTIVPTQPPAEALAPDASYLTLVRAMRGLRVADAGQARLIGVAARAIELAAELADTPEPGLRRTLKSLEGLARVESATVAAQLAAVADAYAESDEDLIEPGAVPGGIRPHRLDSPDAEDPAHSRRSRGLERKRDGDRWVSREQITTSAVGPVLGVGAIAAHTVTTSANHAASAPRTLERLLLGDWARAHADAFFRGTAHLTCDQIREVDAIVAVPSVGRGRPTSGEIATRTTDAMRRLHLPLRRDADREVSIADRRIRFGRLRNGVRTVHGTLRATDAAVIDTLLTDLAQTADPADRRTLDNRRADVFVTCFTGPAALSPAARTMTRDALAAESGLTGAELGEDYSEPVAVPDGYYLADAQQTADAADAWATLELIGAGLGLTFCRPPSAVVEVHVPLDVALIGGRFLHEMPTPADDRVSLAVRPPPDPPECPEPVVVAPPDAHPPPDPVGGESPPTGPRPTAPVGGGLPPPGPRPTAPVDGESPPPGPRPTAPVAAESPPSGSWLPAVGSAGPPRDPGRDSLAEPDLVAVDPALLHDAVTTGSWQRVFLTCYGPKVGVLPDEVARLLAFHRDSTWRRIVTDPLSGAPPGRRY